MLFILDFFDLVETGLNEGDHIAVVFLAYLVQFIVVLDKPVQKSESVGIWLMLRVDASPLDHQDHIW